MLPVLGSCLPPPTTPHRATAQARTILVAIKIAARVVWRCNSHTRSKKYGSNRKKRNTFTKSFIDSVREAVFPFFAKFFPGVRMYDSSIPEMT